MMHGFDRFEHDDAGIVFRDLMTLALCGFVVCVVLIMPHINPPGAKTVANAAPPGNVMVEIRWPDEIDADVDLWVQGPGDVPVGYSNKGGRVFNLLRDDLGKRNDATDLNYENAYSRGIVPGDYTVNVHLYRDSDRIYPVPVTVVTSVNRPKDGHTQQLLASKVLLNREGEETTVYRFRLTAAGDLVSGSVTSLFKELRTWRPS
jgi:hypothetical protein